MKHEMVAGLLSAHTPFDDHERHALVQFHPLLAHPSELWSALWSRDTVDPGHFTSSALVVSEDGLDVLLIHHAHFGLWIQPGGHVDPTDASPLEAALRELEEETSLARTQVTSLGLLDVDVHDVPDGIKGQSAHKHFDLRFAFRAHTRAVRARSDAKRAAWFPRAHVLQAGAVQTDDSVRAAVRRLARLA